MNTRQEKLWKKILLEIEKTVSRANFLTLFKNTSLLSVEDSVVLISAPSLMIVDMLQKRFTEILSEYFEKELGNPHTITFTVKALPILTSPSENGPLFVESSVAAPTPLTIGHLPRVRPDFTFQNFAVSSSNQLAFVSSTTVASHIGTSYNPFFLYGPVGVGKTHLMHAIANEVYQKQPSKKILYVTSEEFTNEVVEAIRHNETAGMKRKFRSSYLLLIDDIQFIEGKERVQEELFHTFNILIDNRSQIVLSSDRPPHEIKRLEKRLSSRFSGGLSVDIEAPDFELKTAIILIKAKKFGFDLSIDIAKLIAEQAQDTRSLEGLLLRIYTQSTTLNQPLTVELAEKSLGLAKKESRTHIHADDVLEQICEFYQIKLTQLRGPKRDASLVRARQIAMYVLKHELHLTFVEIGNILGGRDHTTVMYGVEKIDGLVDTNTNLAADILGITKQLRG